MKHSDLEDWRNGGFGLYVHWPFCASKCPYCDFNSHVSSRIDQERWLKAYVAEIAAWGERTQGRVLDSIFFGGGTPSLMPPEAVAAVIDAARRAWGFRNSIEITLEANPTSVEAGRFRAFSDAGVNRVSMGIQALNDRDLRLLGRQHSAREALKAWDVATHYFDRASFDLIYARQHQTLEAWRAELSAALAMGPRHLSLYQLTIEDGTVFGARHRVGKLPGLPDDETCADMFDLTQEMCESTGLAAYETSNHAVPGEESLHNQIYWRYGDYVGIGPGAHGRVTLNGQRLATVSISAPSQWIEQRENNMATQEVRLTGEEQASEYLMMSLRLNEGLDLSRHGALRGRPLAQDKLIVLEELGLVVQADGRLITTKKGRPLLNAILRELL